MQKEEQKAVSKIIREKIRIEFSLSPIPVCLNKNISHIKESMMWICLISDDVNLGCFTKWYLLDFSTIKLLPFSL